MNTFPEFLSKKAKSGLFRLGIYQIIGGLIGVGFAGWAVIRSPVISSHEIIFFSTALLLFGYSIFCGALLLRSKEPGLNFTLVNQFMQLIGWTIFGFAFHFSAGILLSIGFEATHSVILTLNWGLSRFEITFNLEPDKIEVNFNLVTLFLIYFTSKLKSRIKKEEMLMEIEKIGEPGNERQAKFYN